MLNYPYNNNFSMNSMPSATQPYGYPMYPNMYQQGPQSMINTNKTYVSGIEDVRLTKLPPNSEYIFLDNTKSLLYQKKVDANGQFDVKTYALSEYKDENEAQPQSAIDLSNYVPRNEFDALQSEIKALNDKITKLTATGGVGHGTTATATTTGTVTNTSI